jgi:hypothetical protein
MEGPSPRGKHEFEEARLAESLAHLAEPAGEGVASPSDEGAFSSHHVLGGRFEWWRRWRRVEVRRAPPETGWRGANPRRR